MFEPQDHPNDFAYPGGPPIPPYDIAGWTLALQMGVKFDRILDEFNGPFSPLTSSLEPPTGIVTSESAPSHLLRHESNNAYIAVNRLLKSGAEVSRLSASLEFGGSTYPPGAFHITANSTSSTLIDQSAKGLGLTFTGLPIRPIGPIRPIRPTKIALWDRFGGSMTSGWTRWILEQFEFPFDVLYPPDLDSGRLSAYDLLILPDGAIPALRTARAPSTDSGDTPAAPIAESTIPEEYRVRRGAISESTTLPRLRQFLESGGTIF